MTNLVPSENITVGNRDVELVDECTYLGHKIQISRNNQTCEWKIRIIRSCAAHGKLRNII